MTKAEIHDFGVEVVFGQIEKEGFEVQSVNTDTEFSPQIVARKDGEIAFIIVRTECYPNKGKLEDEEVIERLIHHAEQHNATCYFASIGIANAEARSSEEMSLPIKGAGFNIAYTGLEVVTVPSKENWRTSIANSIYESHKHRKPDGTPCSICGVSTRAVASHIIKFCQDEEITDEYGTHHALVSGGYPICDVCAPACSKCQLPIVTSEVKKLFKKIEKEAEEKEAGSVISWGIGRCEHIRILGFTL